jgi:PAS domain S-box-containing protein
MFGTWKLRAISRFARRHIVALTFVSIGAGVVAVGAFVANDLSNASGEVRQTYTESISGLDLIGELQYQTQEARRSMLYALATSDKSRQREYSDAARTADDAVSDLLHQHQRLGHSPSETSVAVQLDADWSAYLQIRYKVMALILAGNSRAAIDLDLSSGVPAFDRVREDIKVIKQFHKTQAETRMNQVGSSYNRSLVKLLAILALVELISVVAARMVQRSAMLGALQRSESRLRDVIESINEGMCVIGADNHIELWNKAAELNWRRTREETVGKKLTEVFPALADTPLPRAIWDSRQTGHAESIPDLRFDVRGDDGRDEVFETRIFPFESGATVFFNDVTDKTRAEEARRESEQRYRNLFDNATLGIYRVTPEGRFLIANSAMARLLGYDSFEEMSADGVISEEFRANLQRDRFNDLIEQDGEVHGMAGELKRRDGSSVFIRENSRATRNPDGSVACYEGTIEDVTEQKTAEDALRESQALFDSVINSLPVSVFCKDPDGRFTFANRFFCQRVGKPPEELVGKTDHELFPSRLADKHREDDLRAVSGEIIDFVEEQVGRNQNKTYIRAVKSPRYDASGRIAGMQGIFWDITEEKEAQDQLASERDLLYSLMDNIPEIIYFKDADGRFTRVNKAMARYLGLVDPGQAVGRTDFDFFPEEYAAESKKYDRQIIAFAQPVVGRVERVTSPDGIIHWMLSTRAPVRDKEGSVTSIVGIARDITERKQSEDALEKALAELLGVVSLVSQGDLTRRGAEGDDTLGRIARSLNQMLDDFGGILGKVMDLARSVSSNAIEVMTASEQISIGSDRQVGEVASTSSAVEEMAASMNQVSKNAAASAEAARLALVTAKQGDATVRETSEAMLRINASVLQTAEKMRALAKRSSEISEIINLINGIASQTNLLAVNAAIQAAHAGEAGLGFSVVAEEIRKLAEGSATAMKDIAGLVTAIQRETAEAISAMEDGMLEVQQGSSLAQQARQSLHQISAVVKHSTELIEEISIASDQQAQTTQNVAGAMQTISTIAIETSSGAQETTQTVSEMVSLSERLNQAISQFTVKDNGNRRVPQWGD